MGKSFDTKQKPVLKDSMISGGAGALTKSDRPGMTPKTPLNQTSTRPMTQQSEAGNRFKTNLLSGSKTRHRPALSNIQFGFSSQQIANTPYHLVKEYPTQTILKKSDFDNTEGRAVNCEQI